MTLEPGPDHQHIEGPVRQKKLPNKLAAFVDELEPFRSSLQGVAVESTFNWYWLVDGLQTISFRRSL